MFNQAWQFYINPGHADRLPDKKNPDFMTINSISRELQIQYSIVFYSILW